MRTGREIPRPYWSIFVLGTLLVSGPASADTTAWVPTLVQIKGAAFERGGDQRCPTSGEAALTQGCSSRLVADELPSKTIQIETFLLCTTEVTQAQWFAVMGGPPVPPGSEALPKTSVTWHQVQEFLDRLSRSSGRSFRLPTEAEWEYAASRTGELPLTDKAWIRSNSELRLQPVGTKRPSLDGVYDLLGNAWEWTSDWYGEEFYRSSPALNPQGPESGERRVARGGAYNSVQSYARSGARMAFAPDTASKFTGFRCAASR